LAGSIHDGGAAHHEVHRVGIVRPLTQCSLTFGLDELHVQCSRDSGRDFALHLEEIGMLVVETLGPQVSTGLAVVEAVQRAMSMSAASPREVPGSTGTLTFSEP
jgi:hypothetical protein